jgi:hypothetical protein
VEFGKTRDYSTMRISVQWFSMAPRSIEEEACDLSTASQALNRLGDEIRTNILEKPLPPIHAPLVFFFARGFMTFQATALLWQAGFWQDAAVLSRSLREASYQARWTAKRGDEASNLFFVDHERNRRKVMETLSQAAPPEIKAQAQKVVADMEPSPEVEPWWRNWWGRNKSLSWLAGQIGAGDAYLTEYAMLSAFTHSSPAIFSHYLTPRDGGFTLRTRPGFPENREFAHAILWTSIAAFTDLCAVLSVALEIDCTAQLKEVGDALQRLVDED